jgi:tetratricopeptide (TPR) repeat protein/transcriptional regulator with XRE-family HTH domain
VNSSAHQFSPLVYLVQVYHIFDLMCGLVTWGHSNDVPTLLIERRNCFCFSHLLERSLSDRMQKNERFRQHRIRRNWRQQDIADQVQTSLVTVQRWERGIQQPSLYYRAKLCELFGLSAQELGLGEQTASPAQSEPEEATRERRAPDNEVALWNVPYTRNPNFTGRDDLLNLLQERFTPPEASQQDDIRRVALSQAQAIKGLGGIGKTQIAVEYAYRACEQARYTHTLWITAPSEEAILSSFAAVADLLPTHPASGEKDQRKVARAVIEWLEQCPEPWLLIFDNADDLSLLGPYLPRRGQGHVLLTTRASAVGALASSVEVDTMSLLEGIQLLLRRAQRLEQASEEEINEAGNIVVALAQFPLALDQAGAYIEESGCSLRDYLQLYEQHRSFLLARRGTQTTRYPESVATTWSLSFQRVQQINPAAAELLRLCAFLDPDHIPEELLTEGAAHWPARLQEAVADRLSFNQVLKVLLRFSLVKRMAEDRLLSLHRLVQVVQRDHLSPEEHQQWAERVVRAVHTVFPAEPEANHAVWPQCQRLLSQAQMCDTLIQQHHLLLPEAAEVLDRTGTYLCERALYSLAESLLQRALEMREQLLGPVHPLVATSLLHLTTPYWRLGNYAQTEPLYQRTLRIYEQQPEPLQLTRAEVLNDLALLYADQGQYELAEPLYLQAIGIWEQAAPDDHRIATLLNNLALLYKKQGKYRQAEPLYQRALHIREQHLGPMDTLVATFLHNLAALYLNLRKYAQAEPLYQRALHIREQQLGSGHPSVASTLFNLAMLSYDQGQYRQAEQLCQRALHIYEPQLGPTHYLVAFPLHCLALVFAKEGKYEEAERLDQRALHIWQEQLGETHPYVANALHGLALLSAQQGGEQQAQALFEQALRIREQQLGERHLETADVLSDFADFRQARGSFPEAARLYQRALTIREQVLGPDAPVTQTTRERLQAVLEAKLH